MQTRGRIKINDLYCKGCELCIAACPAQVMALDKKRLNRKGYHPVHVYENGCTGCATCALVCPDAAVTVYRDIIKSPPQDRK